MLANPRGDRSHKLSTRKTETARSNSRCDSFRRYAACGARRCVRSRSDDCKRAVAASAGQRRVAFQRRSTIAATQPSAARHVRALITTALNFCMSCSAKRATSICWPLSRVAAAGGCAIGLAGAPAGIPPQSLKEEHQGPGLICAELGYGFSQLYSRAITLLSGGSAQTVRARGGCIPLRG
jgi:hypothetical protein